MLEDKMFDVEHALNMHAYSFVYFPAKRIYDTENLKKFSETIDHCHIYLIGKVPKIEFINAKQEQSKLICSYSSLGKEYHIQVPLPEGMKLHFEDEHWYLSNGDGQRYAPEEDKLALQLHRQHGLPNFEVQYIGQAFGTDGSRNALDRLKKHETLQKISVQEVEDGYRLEILLLEIQPSNKIITSLNPRAIDTSKTDERISLGMEKLFGTSEKERITLYEASLIRYFRPKFNVEFKNHFPSTNMKVLNDCYEKDFSAIVAEICFDEMPFFLFSESVEKKHYHIAKYDLHKDADRKVFFS